MRALEERAEAAEKLQKSLLSIVSHDLRNPLSVMLVSGRLLLRHLAPDDSARRQVDAINRAADEMNAIIQDMLDVAAIRENRLEVTPQPVDATLVVREAVAALEQLATRKGVVLQTCLSPCVEPVLGDREQLTRALTNLLSSALRYTQRGGEIRVEAARRDAMLEIAVSDTGPGFPCSQADLDQPFWAVGTAQTQATTLRVYVAKGIVEAHGGRMSAESSPGAGAVFRFTVPLA